MPDCCAAAECKQSSEQSHVAFFRFPLEPERCKQWIRNCRRPDLRTKTPEYLHRNFKLCSKHFEASMIQKESELRSVLKDGAVPTIFDFAAKRSKAPSGSRKRTRQQLQQEQPPLPAASSPVEAKKAKDDPQAAAVKQDAIEAPPEQIVTPDPQPLKPEPEDPATTKAKEILKVYFKETLAYTGFSIGNNAGKLLGGGPVGQLGVDPVCADKIEPKEVLKLGEDVMREEIRNTLRTARFFSILFQDKAGVEGTEQIAVFIRTVTNDGFPQKHLLGFLPCDVDSDSLFLMLLSEIRNKWGLRMEQCRGFTYLTTGSLCQKLKEFSGRMLREFPQVVLAPSDPYAFNMWLIRAMPVLSIQDVVDTVVEVGATLRRSETLTRKLHVKIAAAYSHIKGEVDRVKEACQNNWEYGTDAFQTMLDILEPLLGSIGEMCTSTLSEVDAAVMERLLRLREKLKNFNFIVTLVVLKHTLCCVSILNPSLRGIISISSTLQYTISNALKLLSKHLQEIPIFHRKWFSDAVGRAKKLGVAVTLPVDTATNGEAGAEPRPPPEDYYRETLSKMVLQYLIDEVKRVLGTEMVRILRWLSLVPSYMADHNFSIRKDKVADANLNNLARPDTFYEELGCWEVKWRHASKRRILPTGVFATLKIPDIGLYPNVQSLLRVLGSIPCINAEVDVYAQYDMVLHRYHSYMREVPAEKRFCDMAFVYVNQDVHFNIDDMVQLYVKGHPDILQLLCQEEVMEVQPSVPENYTNNAAKEELEEPREMILDMQLERPKPADCAGTNKASLKAALKAAVTAACDSQSRQFQAGQEGEVEYVTKSEMNEVLKVCESVVREGILSEVGNSFYSLFVDRALRFGETDFLPLFVRFVDSFDVMRLELMGFVEAGLDTEAMCERLFDLVTTEWGLELKCCRGQAYLGSGEVHYKLKAFACKVQEQHPLAICTHCSCYSFNTWWSLSVPVSAIVRALEVLEKLMLFFSSMPELEKQLDQVIAVGLRESYEKVHEFQGNFCTSWLEKHDSYEVFAQILEPLAHCLESFQNSGSQMWSSQVINQAKKLLHLIRDFDFIVATVTLKNVSSFTRELSAALQKDHFGAASQLCQISGIVASLNRLKTNIKVFHQNWFDEACGLAQSLGVQIKVPDSVTVPRDSLLKPAGYYKDAVSVPVVDHLINSVKDHFSDDHKEALNFLSLVPCSVTMSYTLDSLKSKPPLYIGDLPDPDNFFTELSCWKVKWKTKVVSPTIPDTIFQTLRLPLMQYFANINTLLKIMSVLPSTTLEHCGAVTRHKIFQDYLRTTYAKDRTPCLAVLQVGTNFNRDLDRMVLQCLKVTPKTLEGICLDKESKTIMRNSEGNHTDGVEEMDIQQDLPAKELPDFNAIREEGNYKPSVQEVQIQQVFPRAAEAATEGEEQRVKPVEEKIDSRQLSDSLLTVFKVAARMSRKNCRFSELPTQDQDLAVQELSMCRWDQENTNCLSGVDLLESLVKSVREAVTSEVQESPFFSLITDKVVAVDDKSFVPVFVRFVDESRPKVELLGFLPLIETSDANAQAKVLSGILSDEWGLQMGCCRGQSFMCTGAGSQGLRKMSLGFLESFPLAVNTPSESCGLAYWLGVSLRNEPVAKVLGVVEDLLLFFDQSPRLHLELSKTREGLLNTPREALAEVPETCLSKWKKTEDFFDILVDMLEGVLTCLDSVSNNTNGSWSNSMSIQALMLSTAIRESDFVISLVILKNACAPVRACSTVFRCGNPADIICELERIPLVIDSLKKMLQNIGVVHKSWFEEATQLAAKVAGALSYPETMSNYESPEVGYREAVSRPVLQGLIEEMKFNFSEFHLRALKVLSLLPTCNPLPVLPEAKDKLYTIYQSDLPDPDTAEEEINTWAAVWREKYQDGPPPASISETLKHPESKGHPNVTALLRLVAVLPSISMEFDLMKTTFNSLRALIAGDVTHGGGKINAVMLLMHRQVLQTLGNMINKCMEVDPKSHGLLSQVKQMICEMIVDEDVFGVLSEERANVISSENVNGTPPISTQDQPKTTSLDLEELRTSANDVTATPEDETMNAGASHSLVVMQMACPVSSTTYNQSAMPNPAEQAVGTQDSTMEASTLLDGGAEVVTETQIATTEPLAEGTDQKPVADEQGTLEGPIEAPEVTTDQEKAVQGEITETVQMQDVSLVESVEHVATIGSQDVMMEPVVQSNNLSMEVVPTTQNEPIREVASNVSRDPSNVLTEPVLATEEAILELDVNTEPAAKIEVQSVTAELLAEVANQNVSLTSSCEVNSKSVSTEKHSIAAQSLTPNVAVQAVTTDVTKEEKNINQGVSNEVKSSVQDVVRESVKVLITSAVTPDVSPTSNGVSTELVIESQSLTADLIKTKQTEQQAAAQIVNKDLGAVAPEIMEFVEIAGQDAPTEPSAAAQEGPTEPLATTSEFMDVTTEQVTPTQVITTEPIATSPKDTRGVVAADPEFINVTMDFVEQAAQDVTTDLVRATQDVTTIPGAAVLKVTTNPVREAENITTELIAAAPKVMDVTMLLAEPVAQGVPTKPITTAQDITSETDAKVQGFTTELDAAAQGVAAEPITVTRCPPTESVSAAHGVTKVSAVNNLVTQPVIAVKNDIPEQGTIAPEVIDVTMELVEPAPTLVITEQVAAAQASPAEQVAAAQASPAEQVAAAQASPAEQVAAAQASPAEQVAAAQASPAEQVAAAQASPAGQVAAAQASPAGQVAAAQASPAGQVAAAQASPAGQVAAAQASPAGQVAAAQASPAEPVAAAQASPAEPVAAAQASPAEPVAAAQASPAEPVAAAQASPAEPVAAAQASPAEPVAAAQASPAEPVAAAPRGVLAGQVVAAAQPTPTEQAATAPQDVQVPAAQSLPTKQVAAFPEVGGVTMELTEPAGPGVPKEPAAAAPNTAKEQETIVPDIPTEPTVAAQKATTKTVRTVQEVMEVTMELANPAAQGVPTSAVAAVQNVSTVQVTAAHGISTGPLATAQEAMDVTMELAEPATEMPIQGDAEAPPDCVTAESTVQNTKELVNAEQEVLPKTGEAHVTIEKAPAEPRTSQDMHVTASKDALMEVSVAPQHVCMEAQDPQGVSTQCVTNMEPTASLDMNPISSDQITSPKSTKAATQGVCVTMTHAASTDLNPEPTTTNQDGTFKPTAVLQLKKSVTTAEGAMDTKDETVASVPKLFPQDATMGPETASEDMSTEPTAKVHDNAKPVKVTQDVSSISDEQVQDVSMDTSEDLDVPVALVTAANQKADGQGVGSEVVQTTESGVNKSNSEKIPALQGGIDKPVAASQGTQSNADGKATPSVDQSYATAQNDADSTNAAAEQQSEVAQPAVTEPHKGVLSSYAFPAQEAFLNDKTKFFSITYEQHVEIEGHIYIPIGVCYLENHETLCEDVLAYVPLGDDAAVFVDSVTTALSDKWSLNLDSCRGQSLLTVGSAGAQIKAAASLFSQRFPQALRTFNNSVSLNTWLARSCTVTGIAESFIWVENLLQWMTEDAENQAKLHKTIMFVFQHDEKKHSELRLRLTRSQWERSHDTLDFTVEVMEAVVLCLNDMKENSDVQAERTQAVNFLIVLQSFEFILILVIMKNILRLTKDLSHSLQGEALEIFQTVNSLPGVLSSLKDMATNIDTHFQNWYQEAVEIGSKMQIGVDPAFEESIVCHYRDIVCRGAIEHSLSEITELWTSHVLSALRCLQVVPYVLSRMVGSCTDSDVFKMFRDDLPDWGCLQAELLKWREKWLGVMVSQKPVPLSLLDTLRDSDMKSFPNVEALLQLLVVLPCCKPEDSIRQGKMSLTEFQHQRSLLELYPL